MIGGGGNHARVHTAKNWINLASMHVSVWNNANLTLLEVYHEFNKHNLYNMHNLYNAISCFGVGPKNLNLFRVCGRYIQGKETLSNEEKAKYEPHYIVSMFSVSSFTFNSLDSFGTPNHPLPSSSNSVPTYPGAKDSQNEFLIMTNLACYKQCAIAESDLTHCTWQ